MGHGADTSRKQTPYPYSHVIKPGFDAPDALERYPYHQQKILVIAHREELLNQAADKIARSNPALRVEIEQADRKVSPMADVIVASVQTLVMGGKRRLKKIDPDSVRVIITDECHHATSPSYVQIFQHFGCLPPDDWGPDKPAGRDADAIVAWQNNRKKEWDFKYPNQPLLVGFTATPKRSDRVGLDAVFDEIVYSMNMRDGIAQGWLSPLKAIKVSTHTSLDDVKTTAGDLNIGDLGAAVNNEDRNALAVKSWLEAAENAGVIDGETVEPKVTQQESDTEIEAEADSNEEGSEEALDEEDEYLGSDGADTDEPLSLVTADAPNFDPSHDIEEIDLSDEDLRLANELAASLR